MLARLLRRCLVLALGVAALMLVAPRFARGAPHPAGHIVLSLPGGGTGPLELNPSQGSWAGTFTVTNLGSDSLVVSRVALRGDELDVRSPPHLSVHFVDGPTTSATLAPGAAKDVVVTWMPDRDPRVRQAFGQVIVTSSDEESGEVAMGFRAQLPTGLGVLGAHVLSTLVVLPLLVMLVVVGLRLAGHPDHPIVASVALGVTLAELLLTAWLYQRFSPSVGRVDGNDGFQFVERALWVRSIGAEWYLGVDGVSVALVLLTALVASVAIAAPLAPDRRTDSYYSAMALLLGGLMAAFTALDLLVLLTAWGLVLFAMVMLVGGWGSARATQAAAKTAVYGAIASVALLASVVAVSRASSRALLVDGTAVAHTLAIPELARTSFASRGSVLGVPFAAGAWALLFVAAAVISPTLPLHGWLGDALEESPSGAAMVIAGAVVALGPYLLVRVGLSAIGEAAPWAGPWVATIGVLATIYGALGALAQRTLRRFVAFASLAGSGACIFGLGTLTAQGVAGAVAILFARGVAVSLLLGVAGALEARGTRRGFDALERTALARRAPHLTLLLGVGLAVSLGIPCLAGFWGPFLVSFGGFAQHPAMTLFFAFSLVALAAGHVRVARLALSPTPDSNVSPRVFDDARPRELAALAPLVVLALLLGLWPVPLLSQIAKGASDASSATEQEGVTP
jgi:NADH-quinone oxidoreductase subunit M